MATVKFYLNHPHEKGTDTLRKEEVSIDLFFTLSRTSRIRISTGLRIQPKYWNFDTQESRGTYPGHQKLNIRLGQMKRDIIELWMSSPTISLNQLKAQIIPIVRGKSSTEEKPEKKRIWQAWDEFDKSNQSKKKEKTVKKYNALLSHLIGFELYNSQHQNPIIFDIDKLDNKFVERFKEYLYNLKVEYFRKDGKIQYHKDGRPKLVFPNSQYAFYRLTKIDDIWTAVYDRHFDIKTDTPVPLMDETVNKYIANIKTFLTESKGRGYAVDPVYEKWEVTKRRYPVISLTETELINLETLDLSKVDFEFKKHARTDQRLKAVTQGRDYLTQECRTGARISDIKKFSPINVKDMVWRFLPTKGDRENSVLAELPFKGFSLPAWLTFQKYNFKMPRVSEQKINENMRLACKYAGITEAMYIERWAANKKIRIYGEKWEFISSHTGRKTFVTILGNKYKVPIKVLMKMTGIQDIKTIQHYLGESEVEVSEYYLEQAAVNTPSLMKKAN
ncbi:MAG TPA: hypothetical protein VD927_06730 [Chryseosolibacter sp.]|nr:hypothetical protein [Chryseosolibacter sp.]